MMNFITSSQERTRFLKFMTVGAIGALVDFGIMNLLTLVKMTLTVAGSFSFIAAVLSNFFWNRYWTYPDSRSRPLPKQLLMFLMVNIAGLIIRIPILHFLEPFLNKVLTRLPFLLQSNTEILGKNFTLMVAVGVVMLWNFFVNRYWTYNDVEETVINK